MKKNILFFMLLSIYLSANSQNSLHFCDDAGYSNAIVIPKNNIYTRIGKLGFIAGFKINHEFNKFYLGSGLFFREINYVREDGKVKQDYGTLNLFVGKKCKFLNLEAGLTNNFYLQYKDYPQYAKDLGFYPDYFYTISVYAEPQIKITKNLALDFCSFLNLIPNKKMYGSYNGSGIQIVAADFAYGFMIGLEYGFFKF